MTNHHESHSITVVTQNVLLDKTRTNAKLILPQDDRIAGIAQTLRQAPGRLDVVGIQEVHRSKYRHNGQALAEELGYGLGEWAEHNEKPYSESPRGRSGEYIGLFGAAVGTTEEIELGDRRKALLTEIAGVAFVTFHPRAGASLRSVLARRQNAGNLMKAIDGYDDAVIFGDVNEPDIPIIAGARATFARNGFESVFTLTDQSKPITFPTPSYAELYGTNRQFNLDDIYVRGNVRVIGAGILQHASGARRVPEGCAGLPDEPTDHYGVFAALDLPPIHD